MVRYGEGVAYEPWTASDLWSDSVWGEWHMTDVNLGDTVI